MKNNDKVPIIIGIILSLLLTFINSTMSGAIFSILIYLVCYLYLNYYKLANGQIYFFKIIGFISGFTLISKIFLETDIKGHTLFYLVLLISILLYFIIIELPIKIKNKKSSK